MFSSQPPPPPLCSSSLSILFPLLLHREELLIQAFYKKTFFSINSEKNTTEKKPPLERTSEMSEKMTNMTSKQSVRCICWQKIVRHEYKYYRDANFSLLALTKLLGTHRGLL